MRKIVVPGVALSLLAGAVLVLNSAGALPGERGIRADAGQVRAVEKAEPGACRKICFEGVCSERCLVQPDNEGSVERRVYRRDRWRDRDRYRDDDQGPSFRFELR